MLRLKVVASENALPSLGGGLVEEPPHLPRTLLWRGGGILLIPGGVNDTFRTRGPTPRHC